MSMDFRSSERRRYVNDLQAREKEIAAVLKVSSPSSPKSEQMNDKRVRREIANGNERRRMQCINAGFTSLRALIPHLEGEKLSKAAILQHSIDYITSLEKDKSRLQMQLERTTHLLTELGQHDRVLVDSFVTSTPPPSKRKKRDTESSDEGVGSLSDASDDCGTDLRQKHEALTHQMDRERQRGDSLEEENKSLRNLIYLIQKQTARDQQPITLVTSAVPQENRMREVVEVMSPRMNYTPPLHQDEMMEYSVSARPSSLTPDSTVAMSTSNVVTQTNTMPRGVEPVSVMSNVQIELRDTPSIGFPNAQSPSILAMASPGLYDTINTSSGKGFETTQASVDSAFLHNYAHRDHPRRRRHQAQLERERIEEEERQQKEQEELQMRLQQQQPLTTATTYIPRPQHSVRSLDILAEAANHVKDDRTSHLYEGDSLMQPMDQPILFHLSEETASRIGNQLEIKSENSDRISQCHNNTTLYTTQSSLPLLHQSLNSHVPIIVTTAPSENNNSTSFSEKYPIAAHLLHQPLHTPFTRPGVIVQKH